MKRTVLAYKNYFLDFYTKQNEITQRKIEWTLKLLEVTVFIHEKFFKHIEGTKGLYEIRIEVQSNTFRIFCFFDKGNIIVLGNAFQKKQRKTPKIEIERALNIMEEYKNENK